MKPLNEQENGTVRALCTHFAEVMRDGFRIDLSAAPENWDAAARAIGTKRLCRGVVEMLSDAYAAQQCELFLFSERCMTFELKYHLNAYLCIRGFRRVRHVTTLLFPKRTVERTCRSVEIDRNDVYRTSQRLAFRYFFGIRKEYRCTARDPYAKRIGTRYVRIPFYRLLRRKS